MPYLSDRQYGLLSHRRLLIKLKNSSSITRRLQIGRTLNVHRGCVNTIWWNDHGTTILSGSDDQNLIVTDPYTRKVLTKVHSGHRENIFSAKFLPETNDRRVVSCSGDGVIFHTNFDRRNNSHSNEGWFTCHGSSTAYEVRIIPHTPNLFLSCSGITKIKIFIKIKTNILYLDDCTVRLYDLRTKSNCLKDHCHDDILIKSHWGITSMDINPMNPNEIVSACADGVS
jgi:nuclear receptor interaction protein